jgi:hypothetical protein
MARVKAKQDTESYEVITQVDEATGDVLVPLPPEFAATLVGFAPLVVSWIPVNPLPFPFKVGTFIL